MLELRWIVLSLMSCTVLGQFELDIIDYQGLKYLKFHHPCTPDDTYCPLTCSQKYAIQDEASKKLCVRCLCNNGQSGITKPIFTTTTPPTTQVTTSSATSSTTEAITTTTPIAKEVVMINGIPNLLVDLPCSPRDNVCPIYGCTVDGAMRSSEFCFHCECGNKTVDETRVSTTASTVPSSTVDGGVSKFTKDTLVVNGVESVIVSDPCRTSDNLCPVEGCTVDLTIRGNDVCFTCNCTKATARRSKPAPAKERVITKRTVPRGL